MKRKADFLFITLLLAVSALYGYHDILFARPAYHHIWRQADCLSMTMNYYQDNRNFFRPAVNWVGDHGGRTISEFPIIYFTVGQLWKVFGHHEFMLRLIDLLIVFTGLFSLFRFLREFLSDTLWAIIVPFFLFSSPILGYFTNNFLADAPALGLALTGGYVFWKAVQLESRKWYYFSFLLFLTGGLLKPSALLLFFGLLAIHLYSIVFQRNKRDWYHKATRLWPYLWVIILIMVWTGYTIYYNTRNLDCFFLHGIFPIWGTDAAGRAAIWESFTKALLKGFFNIYALIFLAALFLSMFIFFKKVNRFFLFLTLLVFSGCILFFLLFYQAFNVHDYYLINLLIFIPFPLIVMLDMLHRNYPRVFRNIILKTVASIGVIVLLYMGAVNTRMRYYPRQDFVQKSILVEKEDITNFIKWSDYCGTYFKVFETITPYLRSLGIKRDDLVYSTPDGTYNVTLYLMDQKGFSDWYIGSFPEEKRMETVKSLGARYLIINDSALYSKPYIQPYLHHKLGTYKNVEIFDLNL
ncbi:MAG: ArnT family glycosyltransferase [Bacteroidales bacterium]